MKIINTYYFKDAIRYMFSIPKDRTTDKVKCMITEWEDGDIVIADVNGGTLTNIHNGFLMYDTDWEPQWEKRL